MSRPDEHPDLVAMGQGEATCEKCMYELFPTASDDICNDCTLYPMQDEESRRVFIEESLKRESEFSLKELAIRHALNSLPDR